MTERVIFMNCVLTTKVLCLGSLNIDHVYSLERIVRPGETVSARKKELFAGGKGLNQAIALARAGAPVSMAGKIDRDGAFLTDTLREYGVEVSLVDSSGSACGHTVIQVEESGQNCIIYHAGANRELTEAYIDRALAGFGPGDCLVMQNEVNLPRYAIRQAAARGIAVALNPSPIDDDLLAMDLTGVTYLLLNELEGYALTGEKDPGAICAALLAKAPDLRVALTLGQDGVRYQDRQSVFTHGIYPVTAVDTTAAGDTFTGYFLTEMLAHGDVPTALLKASLAAALAVSRMGAARSIPTREEVAAMERERKET